MFKRSFAFGLFFTATACAPSPDSWENPAAGARPILGGSADTTHAAVAALLQAQGSQLAVCSGTTIDTVGQTGIFLTAAHCVVALDVTGLPIQPLVPLTPTSMLVVPGNDWIASGDTGDFYEVLSATPHPQYDGDPASPYDIAVVQYAGALPSSPTTPILSAAEDDLVVGTELTAVGYGVTDTDDQNSTRRSVGISIAEIVARQFANDQTSGEGMCSGDSGGPSLYATADGDRVAGVTSFSDASCVQAGFSVRVSAYESFIENIVSQVPATLSCGGCELAVGAAGNVCQAAKLACSTPGEPCDTFIQCVSPCTTTACVNACATNHAQGVEDYAEYLRCVCEDGCASECSAAEACQNFQCGGFGSSDVACNQCVHGSCCAQGAACGNDAICSSCMNDPSQPRCTQNQPFVTFVGCLSSCNGNPCGAPTIGSGGNGGSSSGGNAGASATGGSGMGDAGDGNVGGGTGGRTGSGGTGRAGAPSTSAGASTGGSAGASEDPSQGEAGASTSAGHGGDGSEPPAGSSGDGDTKDDGVPDKSSCACGVPGAAARPLAFPWLGLALAALATCRRRARGTRLLG